MLRCEECGAEAAEESRGWRALLAHDVEADADCVGVFCPECAEREFGPLDAKREKEQ